MHPILLRLGSWQLSTYGFFVALAYLTAIVWLKSQISSMPGLDEDKFWILIYGLFFGAIVGGKLLYILVDWQSYRSGQMRFFRDFRFGFVFYGGFLGALAAGIWLGTGTSPPTSRVLHQIRGITSFAMAVAATTPEYSWR